MRQPLCPACDSRHFEPYCDSSFMRQDARQILECQVCGLSLLWPLPSLAELDEYYGAIYFGFGKADQLGKGYALAKRLQDLAPQGRFLDVGCATGFLLKGIADHSAWSVSGVDYGASAVRYARKTLGLDVRQGTLAKAGFKADSFDVLHLNNVLEHELDPLALLKASARVLKPGGRIWLATPNGAVDRSRYKAYRDGWGRNAESQDGHTFFYSGESLDRLAAKAGLRVDGRWSAGLLRGARGRGWLPRPRGWHKGVAPRDRGPRRGAKLKRPIEASISEGKRRPRWYYRFKEVRERWQRLPGYWPVGFDYHMQLGKD